MQRKKTTCSPQQPPKAHLPLITLALIITFLCDVCGEPNSNSTAAASNNQMSYVISSNKHSTATTTNSFHNNNVFKPAIESIGNVTVLAGKRGELKCRVSNLSNNTVLWLRHRDTHLLTSGPDAYTADPRFRAFQTQENIWGLRVSSTRPSDGGQYECQVSTTPPVSAFTFLTVVEPITHIEGLSSSNSINNNHPSSSSPNSNNNARSNHNYSPQPPPPTTELFIKAGSTINLTCVVEDATDNAPKHILWRHNSRVVNFEWARGGMSLVTEKKSKGVTVSRLLIQKAIRTDSGTYMCAPHNAHPAYVKIVVLEQGEKQAAMQSSLSTRRANESSSVVLLLFIFHGVASSSIIRAS